MSANSKIKWSEVPEDDRPFSVALSQQEVIVLVKWHTAQAKRIPQIAGKAAMNLMTGCPLKARDSRTLFEEAGKILARHTTRARGLLSILPKK
jgi:hypothetical protein